MVEWLHSAALFSGRLQPPTTLHQPWSPTDILFAITRVFPCYTTLHATNVIRNNVGYVALSITDHMEVNGKTNAKAQLYFWTG
jgi:hypothetical protein